MSYVFHHHTTQHISATGRSNAYIKVWMLMKVENILYLGITLQLLENRNNGFIPSQHNRVI
jgi:hypothetical protein